MRGKASSSRRKKRRIPEEAEEDEEEVVVLSSSTTSGTTTTSDDDDEEEDVQKTKKKRRGKQPSRETIKCAFEQLCAAGKAEEDRKQQHHSEKEYDDEKKAGGGGGGKGGVIKGFSIQNLLEMCVKFGYQNWTVLDVENMIRAYELSEARGEIIRINNHLDSKQNKEDVLLEVTEKGFREIVENVAFESCNNNIKRHHKQNPEYCF